MTSIRTIWGCSLAELTKLGADINTIKKASQVFAEKKWLTIDEEHLKLTNAGKLFADGIASDLFFDED